MRKRILILLTAIFLIAFAVIPVISQTSATPGAKIDSVQTSVTIQPVSNGEKPIGARASDDVCDQRLAKTLDAYEKAQRVIDAQAVEIRARSNLQDLSDQQAAKLSEIIAAQEKLIKILQKQTGRKVSIFFGLVKIRY